MNGGIPVRGPAAPYVPPCSVLIDPESDTKKCGKPAGGHTILDCALCDECWDAIQAL